MVIISDPKIPIGIPFLWVLASCAAVDTTSKPMKAKNTTPAPLRIPPTVVSKIIAAKKILKGHFPEFTQLLYWMKGYDLHQ
jgi:hypothetical protein